MADTESHNDEASRRDFLYVATAATGTVVTGAAIWPLVDQMNPSADVLALASIRVDISGVAEGTQIRELWQGKPVFIRHRTAGEIEEARDVALSDLKDPQTDEERALDDEGKYLVMLGVCTHLGCVPLGDGAGDYNGWFCPCHGSHYDTSGRIRKGPAPYNLEIPPLEMVDETTIQIG
ncbi:MAG: ubiquinol-cytochrome c reductase iron-sulfur subunit [Pseudomonadota bacterium]